MPRRKPKKTPYQPPDHELVNKRERTGRSKQRAPRSERSAGRQSGPRRPLEPPSFRRILRRLPVAFVVFFALQYFLLSPQNLNGEERLMAALTTAALMAALFVPLSYLMDRMMYRGYQRRMERDRARAGRE